MHIYSHICRICIYTYRFPFVCVCFGNIFICALSCIYIGIMSLARGGSASLLGGPGYLELASHLYLDDQLTL